MIWRYGTQIPASRHIIMMTSAVIRSLVLCKSLVTLSLAFDIKVAIDLIFGDHWINGWKPLT